MGRGIEADCKRLIEGQNIHFNQSFFLSCQRNLQRLTIILTPCDSLR